MFLPKDHAAFEIDRKRLAVWTDIRHLQWGFAQRREYGELRQHGRTLQRKWLALFYLGTNPHQRNLLLRFYSKLANLASCGCRRCREVANRIASFLRTKSQEKSSSAD